MTTTELILALSKITAEHGVLPVMFMGERGESHYPVDVVTVKVAEEDEFPADWNMPKGYTFVEITGG